MTSAPLILIGPLPPPIDGQSLAFALLARGLSAGRDVRIVNIARPGEQFERSRVARVVDYVSALRSYARELRRAPGAVVYLTVAQSRAGFLRDAAFIGLARLSRRRVVAHVHGGNYGGFAAAQSPALRALIRRVLAWTDAIIVLAERLRSMFDFAPELAARIRVVPNGFPGIVPALRGPKAAPERGSPWRILFLSNLVEAKGYLELIEAVSLLVKAGLEVELDLCGEFRVNPSDDRRVRSPAQARELTEATIRRLGLEDRVRIRGTVSGDEKDRLLAESHWFALPTRYDAEGQPISIIEAMAWGCPVIATDYRGIPDLVADGETGWLLATPDPAAIAGRLRQICATPEVFSRASAAARARFEERFTPEAHLRAMRAVLDG